MGFFLSATTPKFHYLSGHVGQVICGRDGRALRLVYDIEHISLDISEYLRKGQKEFLSYSGRHFIPSRGNVGRNANANPCSRFKNNQPLPKDLPDRSTSKNPFINGTSTWSYPKDGQLCVRCGTKGHGSLGCSNPSRLLYRNAKTTSPYATRSTHDDLLAMPGNNVHAY